jgi:hypothetical protein
MPLLLLLLVQDCMLLLVVVIKQCMPLLLLVQYRMLLLLLVMVKQCMPLWVLLLLLVQDCMLLLLAWQCLLVMLGMHPSSLPAGQHTYPPTSPPPGPWLLPHIPSAHPPNRHAELLLLLGA